MRYGFTIVLLCLVLSGCATQDASISAQENREMARAESIDHFLKREAACKQFNKTITVRRAGTRIRGSIKKHELATAQCK